MPTPLKLNYGLSHGQLHHISQVTNGLACGCTCPGCDARLVARNQGTRKAAHFAHYQAPECTHGLQTALHLAAKEIFLKYQIFRLPLVMGQFELTDAFWNSFSFDARPYLAHIPCEVYEENDYSFASRDVAINQVLLERKTENIVPDIILETAGGRLLVEIAVTHFVNDVKRDKIKSIGIPTIEIDLSKVPRDLDLQQLEELLIYGIEEKRWIYNPKLKAKLLAQRTRYFEALRPHFERLHAQELEQAPYRLRQQEAAERRRQAKAADLAFRLQQSEEQRQLRKAEETRFYATQLKQVTFRDLSNGTIEGTPKVKHVDTCPIASRSHMGQAYASVATDCSQCPYFKGYWHPERAIVCLFEHANPPSLPS